ncbi:unnamed protein product [Pleuronectes platessa]|uniref:Rho-related GTP-binding protein Rho6 n=1 Tax=Pleuronectes platessa TaxID=8262 RepID=A0A9N7VQN1_PLEPL|nr:unnamed protein product [Pleuronectes platessa]
MLQVLAKDCYPETYVPTVFENYTACLELEEQRVELSLWDTSGSPYYDNVRPLCYSDSDAVLLCFDISRPDTVDSSLKKWKTEILDFCPSTRILLIGCKIDLRTDVCTLMELSNQKQTPIAYEQGSAMAKQLGAEAYLECSAFTSEKSIHSVFRTAAMACINKLQPLQKPSPTRRLSKRLLHLPSKSDLLSSTFKKEKAKSCSVILLEIFTASLSLLKKREAAALVCLQTCHIWCPPDVEVSKTGSLPQNAAEVPACPTSLFFQSSTLKQL